MTENQQHLAYNRLQAEVFDPLNSYTPMGISDICEDTKSVEYKVLSGYLARIEHFCIGVNEKIYDKCVFYKMAHGYFDGHILYRRIEPILMSKKNAEQYYSNIYIYSIGANEQKINKRELRRG